MSTAFSAWVLLGAQVVALGVPVADPIIGLLITAVILKITWDSWWTVRARTGDPRGPSGEPKPRTLPTTGYW